MARRVRNELRIIGGEWRGQRLRFAAGPGVRPTADRNRETLFNWLQVLLPGSRCLDLFAGSGALGFEAASRGAGSVWLVERDSAAVERLRANAARLGAEDRLAIHAGDALRWLAGPPHPADVIFLDPPFGSDLLETASHALAAGGWTHPATRIYVEHARQATPALPAQWRVLRERVAGDVRFALLAASDQGN